MSATTVMDGVTLSHAVTEKAQRSGVVRLTYLTHEYAILDGQCRVSTLQPLMFTCDTLAQNMLHVDRPTRESALSSARSTTSSETFTHLPLHASMWNLRGGYGGLKSHFARTEYVIRSCTATYACTCDQSSSS